MAGVSLQLPVLIVERTAKQFSGNAALKKIERENKYHLEGTFKTNVPVKLPAMFILCSAAPMTSHSQGYQISASTAELTHSCSANSRTDS